jgi:hypothetical protein
MEVKWIVICVIAFAAAMVTPVTITEYSRAQCKIAYATSQLSAEDVIKVCGK